MRAILAGNNMDDAPGVSRTRPPYLRFLRYVLPHLALTGTFFLYLYLGAWVFVELEGDFGDLKEVDEDKKKVMNNLERVHNCTKSSLEAEAAAATRGHPSTPPKNTDTCDMSVEDVYNDMMENMENKNEWKLARMQSIQSNRTWTFYSSMLFCMTAITTIGYGDIVPVTSAGRIACIIYSIIGIPLTLLCLANIGNHLAKVILFICKYLRPSMVITRIRRDSPCVCCNVPSYQQEEGQWNSTQDAVRGTTSNNIRTADGQGQSQISLNSVRLETLATVSTVVQTLGVPSPDGDGPPHLEKSVSMHSHSSNGVRESIYTSSSGRGSPQMNYKQQFSNTSSYVESAKGANPPSIQQQQSQVANIHQAGMNVDHVSDEVTVEEVPISIASLIFVVYVCVMALSIAQVEKWSYMESFYFTFITLTTIGFGDVLPTAHYSDGEFFSCITFVMFGLAVNSMCISLVQAKVVRFCKRLANKLGF